MSADMLKNADDFEHMKWRREMVTYLIISLIMVASVAVVTGFVVWWRG
jgi:nitrate reductase NapE component